MIRFSAGHETCCTSRTPTLTSRALYSTEAAPIESCALSRVKFSICLARRTPIRQYRSGCESHERCKTTSCYTHIFTCGEAFHTAAAAILWPASVLVPGQAPTFYLQFECAPTPPGTPATTAVQTRRMSNRCLSHVYQQRQRRPGQQYC